MSEFRCGACRDLSHRHTYAGDCEYRDRTPADHRMTAPCWCGQPHPQEPANPSEAWETLWHYILAGVRLPEAVRWLNDRLEARARRRDRADHTADQGPRQDAGGSL